MIMDTLFEECMCDDDEQALQARLFDACMSGDEQALNALIQHDPLILDRTVASCEDTPLHVAVLRGHVGFVLALLGLKPKLASEADATCRVPLHLASAEGSVEIVRELLRVDAELCGARDYCGWTPLHLGVVKGRLGVVRELIRVCPRSASERLDRGGTVFHLAIKYGRLEVLKLLVELVKDDRRQLLVAADDEGNTVLHSAVLYKQIQTVRYLVSLPEVKEIANATNDNGDTALDVMEKNLRHLNSSEIVKTLTQAGVRRGKGNLKHQMEWIANALGNLLMVATVIASISFHAGINPPGGGWQPGIINKDAEVLYYFYSRNTWGLMAAFSVVLLHFGGFPLKSKVGTWLMTLTTCLMLRNMIWAYLCSTYTTLEDVNEGWTLIVLVLVVIVQTTCISCWLMFDKVTSSLSLRSILCRRKWMRTVGFVVGSFVTAYVLALSVHF